jgi:signal transduction histidine kinase
LTVADDGRGFDTRRKPLIGVYGMGMTTMRERAEAIGAHLRIESEIGKGTRIVIEVARTSLPAAQTRPAT